MYVGEQVKMPPKKNNNNNSLKLIYNISNKSVWLV